MRFDLLQDRINNELRSTEITFSERHRINEFLVRLTFDFNTPRNYALNDLSVLISIQLDKNKPNTSDIDLWSYANRIYGIINPLYDNKDNYDELYIKAAILFIYTEKQSSY